MALSMVGAVDLPASRDEVWNALNDVAILRQSIPGCETLEQESEGNLTATATVRIGPITARFAGRVTLSDIVPLEGYRIAGQGQGGLAGFAKGSAIVSLIDIEGGHTRLSYKANADVGGKIAQLGGRLLDSVARKYADGFFRTFAATLAGSAEA